MTENQKTLAALLVLVILVVLWLGGTVATLAYAATPGNAGAIVAAGFVFCLGYGFVQEARAEVAARL